MLTGITLALALTLSVPPPPPGGVTPSPEQASPEQASPEQASPEQEPVPTADADKNKRARFIAGGSTLVSLGAGAMIGGVATIAVLAKRPESLRLGLGIGAGLVVVGIALVVGGDAVFRKAPPKAQARIALTGDGLLVRF